MNKFKANDKVRCNSVRDEVKGVIIKITKPNTIKGFTAKPKRNESEYLVKSNAGNEAVHKSSALTRIK